MRKWWLVLFEGEGLSSDNLGDLVIKRRKDWADIQNEYLEKFGHTAKVDHRSFKERGILKLPELHLGSAPIQQMTEKERKEFGRKRRNSHGNIT